MTKADPAKATPLAFHRFRNETLAALLVRMGVPPPRGNRRSALLQLVQRNATAVRLNWVPKDEIRKLSKDQLGAFLAHCDCNALDRAKALQSHSVCATNPPDAEEGGSDLHGQHQNEDEEDADEYILLLVYGRVRAEAYLVDKSEYPADGQTEEGIDQHMDRTGLCKLSLGHGDARDWIYDVTVRSPQLYHEVLQNHIRRGLPPPRLPRVVLSVVDWEGVVTDLHGQHQMGEEEEDAEGPEYRLLLVYGRVRAEAYLVDKSEYPADDQTEEAIDQHMDRTGFCKLAVGHGAARDWIYDVTVRSPQVYHEVLQDHIRRGLPPPRFPRVVLSVVEWEGVVI